ncbi:hypothetical protein BC939DRAFT_419557 [Gamsiella multidivaricata]|uniref:uncharacterized protein n=1 Tax=Gamsiella multidivaricata TaxID=101098 RepID=UPI0022203518|nr:uncharacterized protein BC939DRAFT_419557 [Gamsiella multidivaricata]KAI7830639.1 hypothetical protein BC939DRAFT_419557 [Gamsiella multidivaricata]
MDNCSSSSSSTHWIALPSNVNTPTRQERNSVSSPRRVTATTFFSSSVNSSPCSFISAISTIEADRDYGAAVEERHELVCCNLPSSSSTFILENELQEQSLSLRRSELSSSRSRDLGYYSHTQLGYEQSQAQVVDQNLHRHNYRYQQPQPQPQPQQQQKQQQKLQWQQKSNDRKKGFGNNGAPQDHAHPQSHNRRCGSDHDLTQHRQQERLSFQVKDKAKYREEQVAPIVDTPLLPVQTSCLTCLPTPLTSGSPSNAPASVTNSASPIVPSPSSSCMCSVVASSIAAPSAVSLAHRRHRTVSSAVASLEFASALSKEHTLMGDSDRCEGEGSHTIAPSLVTLPPHSLFPSYHTAAQNNHDLDLNNKNTTTNNDWDNPVLQSSVSLPTPVPGTVLISSSFAQRLPQPPVQQRDFEAAGEPFTAPSLPSSEDTRLLASGIHSLRQQQLIHQLALQHQQYQQQHLQNSSCSNTTTSSSEFLPFTSNLLVSAHEFVDAATPSTRDMKAPRPSLLSGSLSNSAILTSSPEYMASPTGSSSSSHTPSSSSAFHSPSNSIIWTSSSRATVRRSSTAASRYIESPPESMALGQSKDKGTVRVRRFSRRRVTKACFDGLPRETKIHIFRYLSTFQLVRVSRVSRSWRGIAMDGSLWKAIDTTRYYKSIKDDQLRTLGTAASGFLRYANFRGCVQLTAASLSAIAEHCPNIERLNLTGCRSITSNAISDACMNMPLLVHLDLSGLQAVNNFTLQTMAVYCRSLQVLNLAWCKQISGSGLTKLTRSCQGLRKLNVSGCSSLEDRWMPMMGMNLPKLRELCLNGCSSLTDRGLIGLLSGLSTKLVYLGLSQCRLLTHESLRAISHLCSRHLRRLELSNCENLGDEGLIYLAQHCTHLRLLDLEEITSLTDVSLRAFAMHLPKLERICLSYCENVTDQGIIRMLRPAPNTTTLSTATAMMMNSDATTQYCRKLMHLELDNCLLITDRLLLEFANVLEERYAKAAERMKERERRREERRERLRQKKLFDCRNITLEGVEAAQARSSTLAIRSYYSWTHPSTSGPTTDAAFGGSGGMEGLDAEADEDEDGEESANGTGGMNSSQTSLHHLQLQQQHLQRQQQLLRRHRAANLLHRARVGLLGIPGDAAFTGGARSDGQCVIL